MISRLLKSIILVITGVMLFSCENSLKVIQKITAEDTLASMSAYDVVYERSDSGNRQVVLRCPVMEQYDSKKNDANPYSEFPEGFEITFYDNNGEKVSFISAEYGINYRKKKLLFARKNVVVKNFDTQEQLNTEYLEWDQKKKMIYTHSFVKITSPDNIIFGDSMKAKEDFSSREIYNMRGEIEIKDDDNEN
jgi:LPS export ABC transporter protein LptC